MIKDSVLSETENDQEEFAVEKQSISDGNWKTLPVTLRALT